jgi:4-amino-4-deoxy-L-arabinose transferase-like glycosyltransferase
MAASARHPPLATPVEAVIATIAFAALSLVRGRFAFYEDEGINLQQAAAVAAGHPLYAEVYSDQAPLYRWLLAALLRVFGPSSMVLDVLPAACGALVVAAAAGIALELAGRWAAALTAVWLLALVPFLKFGSTLVIGVAALALATASVLLLLRTGDGRGRLIASGLLFGAAVGVKAATLYFVPMLVACWVPLARGRAPTQVAASLGLWAAGVVAPLACVVALCPMGPMLHQLLAPHAASFRVSAAQAAQVRRTMLLAPGMPLLYVAAAGSLAVALATAARGAGLLAVWNVVVGAWMLVHRPLWAHHLPELLVPLSLALAVGTVAAVRGVPGHRRLVAFTIPACAAAGVAIHWATIDHWRRFYDNSTEAALRALALELRRSTPAGRPILVDRPILAFWAGRSTPPELTFLGRKRIAAGDLQDADLVGALDRDRVSAVVLCRPYLDRYRELQARLLRDYGEPREVALPSAFGFYRRERCRIFERRDQTTAIGRPEP